MSAGPQAAVLPGGRLHLHHGPIDLIIGVDGPARQICFTAAAARFQTVLTELTRDLPDLRRPLNRSHPFDTPIARRMAQAVAPHDKVFVTPMAAVAGAVADDVLATMVQAERPPKAYVNNGGDIALHLDDHASFVLLGPAGNIMLQARDRARGVATSGWQGRSHSLGIADAVTVLAPTAAAADVAATLIANAINLPHHPAVRRVPACALSPDSDLGTRKVTTHVAPLAPADIRAALDAGRAVAKRFIAHNHIDSAVLCLQGQIETLHATGAPAYA